MKNLALAALVVATVILSFLVWSQHGRLAELEWTAVHSKEELTGLKQRVADDDRRIATAEKARTDAETELRELRNRPASTPTAAATVDAARIRSMNALDNPAAQKFLAASFKSTLDQRFGGLFRQLKLSPAELDKFKELLAERQMSGLDVVRAAQTQGINLAGDPASLGTLLSKAQADVDESVRTLLGDERFAQYQDFNQNIASYTLLDQIERRLSYTNAPLNAAQSDALLRVLVQTAPPVEGTRGAMANFAQGMAGLSPLAANLGQRPISNETITAAQAVLSPAQIEGLRQVQAEQRSQAGVLQSMRGASGTAVAAPVPVVTPPSR